MTAIPYKGPLELKEDELRRANRRREALAGAGCATYVLRSNSLPQDSILCLCCSMTSYHPTDIRERYCGFCHAYHSEERPE